MHSAGPRTLAADRSVYALWPLAAGCHTIDYCYYYYDHMRQLIATSESTFISATSESTFISEFISKSKLELVRVHFEETPRHMFMDMAIEGHQAC